jgi:hypothetical protein
MAASRSSDPSGSSQAASATLTGIGPHSVDVLRHDADQLEAMAGRATCPPIAETTQ